MRCAPKSVSKLAQQARCPWGAVDGSRAQAEEPGGNHDWQGKANSIGVRRPRRYGLLAGASASAQGVKIGILNDQSGVYADYGGKGSIEAAKMAIEDFGGSVLGQKIELVTADHQNKPDLAGNIARRWYDAEGVDMITDLTTSSVALAVQEIAAEKKKIDIVVGAATSAISGSACTPYGFHWAFDTHALAVSTGGALVKTGGDTWFFVTVDYAFGHALEKDTSDVIKADGGKVLGSGALRPSTPPISRPSCSRRRAPRRRSSASPTPAKTPSIRSSKRRNSASSPAASGSRRCS